MLVLTSSAQGQTLTDSLQLTIASRPTIFKIIEDEVEYNSVYLDLIEWETFVVAYDQNTRRHYRRYLQRK